MNANLRVEFKPYQGKGGMIGFVKVIAECQAGVLYINDFTARQGQNGLWLANPSKKLATPKTDAQGKVKEYQDIVFGNRGMTEWILSEVQKQVGQGGGQQGGGSFAGSGLQGQGGFDNGNHSGGAYGGGQQGGGYGQQGGGYGGGHG